MFNIKMLPTFTLLIFGLLAKTVAGPVQCSDPTDLNIQWIKSSINGAYIMDSPDPTEEIFTCPQGQPMEANLLLRKRAICPWALKEDSDVNRYPRNITQAVCRCSSCLEKGRCQPVQRKMTVLYKTGHCIDGLNVYKPRQSQISVACTCMLPVPPQQQPTHQYMN